MNGPPRLPSGVSRAQLVAEIDRGRTLLPPRSGRGVQADDAASSDMRLATRVRTALLADPDVRGLAIDVRSSGGIVTLSGTVATTAARDRAVMVAEGVTGVVRVQSRLVVK